MILFILFENSLLADKHTSKDVVTVKSIQDYFSKHKQDIYKKWFMRGEGYVYNAFGNSMYLMYFYLVMDRVTFQKKYAVPYMIKNDTKMSKDIRLLNYIEEALKKENIQECHLFASQLSPDLKHFIDNFTLIWESKIRYDLSIQTIKDHRDLILKSE